jgi:S1-C subfamily serine protease
MHLRVFTAFAFIVVGLVSACAPVQQKPRLTINFDGQSYSDVDSFIAAIRGKSDGQLANVKRVSDPIGGKALVVIPDTDRLRPLVEQRNRGPLAPYVSRLAEVDYEGHQKAGKAIEYSGLFDHVDIVTRNDTTDPPFDGYDYVIFHKVFTTGQDQTGIWQGIWLVKRAPSPETKLARFDVGAPSHEWYNTFISSVRKAAIALGAEGKSGTAAGTGGDGTVNSVLTGVIVATGGEIVTNNHGVANCESMRVQKGEETYPATLVLRDQQNDLAILHVAHTFPTAAVFRESPVHQGDAVAAYGFPLDHVLASGGTFTSGSISAMTGIGDDTRYFQVSVPVQPGNSGGPLLDQNGHLVGIVTAKLNVLSLAAATGDIAQNVNFAIKENLIRGVLETDGIQYATSSSDKALSDTALAARAQEIAVRVQCLR